MLPLKMAPPLKSYPQKISPFLTGMAKGLLLGGETIKLCWKYVHLILESNQPILLLILDISEPVNPLKDDLECI